MVSFLLADRETLLALGGKESRCQWFEGQLLNGVSSTATKNCERPGDMAFEDIT